jgi:hypothetical protein
MGGQVGAGPPADAEPAAADPTADVVAADPGTPGKPPPGGGVAEVPQAATRNPRTRTPARTLELSP